MSTAPSAISIAGATPLAPPKPLSPPVDLRTRRIVLASFWALIFLGVPVWWRTTTLERRTLPNERVQGWSEGWEERIRPGGRGFAATEADARVVKFSPHYKLVFSLLNQDSSAGSAVLDWEINTLLSKHVRPLLSSLSPLHNFSIESQVQYFAPLAVNLNEGEDAVGTHVEEEDLRAFVNNAEWNLASGDMLDPVLHFLLYVPSPRNRPLRIRTADGRDAIPAFITPQRGGLVIFNPPSSDADLSPSPSLSLSLSDFSPSFALFEQQLRTLLGVPLSPSDPETSSLPSTRLSLVVEQRLREAVRDSAETLTTIVKLAHDTPNMQINLEVQSAVKEALDELDKAALIAPSSPSQALHHAARAQSLASQAYFNPSMLALLYFPDEHKYAVYTPLFGPVSVPLLMALLREVKEWRQGKKKRKAQEEERRKAGIAVEGREKAE